MKANHTFVEGLCKGETGIKITHAYTPVRIYETTVPLISVQQTTESLEQKWHRFVLQKTKDDCNGVRPFASPLLKSCI